ncbi:MAG: hypothetical protein M3163_00915, partial [Actinomycetota bacterium]|nr:hypothetical protein [Actinomycetota bacterium]
MVGDARTDISHLRLEPPTQVGEAVRLDATVRDGAGTPFALGHIEKAQRSANVPFVRRQGGEVL